MLLTRPRLQHRGGAGGRRPTRSTAKRWFARCSPTAWRTSGVLNGQGAHSRGGGPPPPLPRAQSADRRESPACQSHQGAIILPGHLRIRAAAPRPTRAAEELQTGDGRPLPPHLKAQVDRELDRLELLLKQIKTVEGERDALLAAAQTAMPAPAAMPLDIKGIGSEFAAVLWSEGLFRHFDNRRQLAAYAGLAPTPWQSGAVDREQGVSKAGNPRLRTTLIQLAWLWLRNQPQSALTIWFHERVRRNGGRLRKTTIVALARKLLVALWKYVTTGVVIEGATMKAA